MARVRCSHVTAHSPRAQLQLHCAMPYTAYRALSYTVPRLYACLYLSICLSICVYCPALCVCTVRHPCVCMLVQMCLCVRLYRIIPACVYWSWCVCPDVPVLPSAWQAGCTCASVCMAGRRSEVGQTYAGPDVRVCMPLVCMRRPEVGKIRTIIVEHGPTGAHRALPYHTRA